MAIHYLHEELEKYHAQQEVQEAKVYQQQAYDSTLKSLFQDQTVEMLSFFIEDVENPIELSETALRPSLRVDRAYLVQLKGKQRIIHMELETDTASDMPLRMLEYYGILYRKYRTPIISLIVCPFRTSITDPPLRVMDDEEELLVFHYRVVRLWKENASRYIDQHKIAVYALLPTMAGANYELLSQALDEMKVYYAGQSHRLANHLLWFKTLLQRSDTVSQADKERIGTKMASFESLLDEDPFVQRRWAEGFAEGEAKGEIKGKTEGLQFAVVTAVENRFPPLTDSIKEKISYIKQPDRLQLLLKATYTVSDEKTLQTMIDLFAA
jgi:hypothetical protein